MDKGSLCTSSGGARQMKTISMHNMQSSFAHVYVRIYFRGFASSAEKLSRIYKTEGQKSLRYVALFAI